jgi:fatty acid desaturase
MPAISIDQADEPSNVDSKRFSLRQAQGLVKSLNRPVAWIYWVDFLTSVITGHALFNLLLYSDRWLTGSPAWIWTVRIGLYCATVLLFLRAVMFTHELVHLPKEGFKWLRLVWNLLCGIPFLIPSFTYYPHLEHHRRKSYGTHEDGEYISLSHMSPWAIVIYMLGILVTPPVAIIRWGILTPLSWFFPTIRNWNFHHASTMVMDITYYRHFGSDWVQRVRFIQELACFGVCLFIVLRMPIQGQFYDPIWLLGYLVSVGLLTLNNVRTLGAHRWTGDGTQQTFEEQLLDSCDYPRRAWITELWGPVGLRFHATHHLFPSIPYHNLGKAHRALMAGLPPDSPFRETAKLSLTGEIGALWKRASQSRKRKRLIDAANAARQRKHRKAKSSHQKNVA